MGFDFYYDIYYNPFVSECQLLLYQIIFISGVIFAIYTVRYSDSPSAVRVWNDNFVYVQRLFEYPAEIRKMIYTTNAIESFNSALRKVTDRKAAFPNEMAVMKILYLRTLDVVKKWTMPYPNWSLIRGKLDFLWGMGWDL